MRPIRQTRQLSTTSNAGVCQNQTSVGGDDLVIDGDYASNGVATMLGQQTVTITSAANLTSINYTIVGTDDLGCVITETIAGPNAGQSTTTLAFKTVTQVSPDAGSAATLEVGVLQAGGGIPIPLDLYISPFEVTLTTTITGTLDLTAQYTFSDIYNEPQVDWVWHDHSDLTNLVAPLPAVGIGTLIAPVAAVRLVTNSGDGVGTFNVAQAGLT